MSNVPLVPGRNDVPSGIDVYSRSRAHELAGQDPKFEYQYVSKNPDHPNWVGNYTQQRELGNPVSGYVLMEPWEVVQRAPGQVAQGAKRADDTKGVDTTMTHGSLILIRTPKENAVKARFIADRMTELRSVSLDAGERAQSGYTRYGAKVFSGNGESGAHAAPVVSAQLTGGK